MAFVAYTRFPMDGRVRKEAEVLAEHGYEIHAIALSTGNRSWEQQSQDVYVHELPMSATRGGRLRYLYQYTLFFILASLALLRLHRKLRFRAVHVHSLPDFQVFCALPLKLMGIPVILDLHEAFPEMVAARFHIGVDSPLVKLAQFAEQSSCRFADRVIAANDGIRRAIIARGVRLDHVITAYNTAQVSCNPSSRETIMGRFGIQAGDLIVHAGGVNRERDLETLLRTLTMLPATYHLVIAGEGDASYIERLRMQADHDGIGQRVRFLGQVALEDARGLMALASLGVVTLEENPLTRLAWPSRIAEFADLRKPLVLPDLPFIRSVVGEGAVYYKPGNAESLTLGIMAAAHAADADHPRIRKAQIACRELEVASILKRIPETYAKLPITKSN